MIQLAKWMLQSSKELSEDLVRKLFDKCGLTSDNDHGTGALTANNVQFLMTRILRIWEKQIQD